jgi:hypothetical protein
VIDWYDREGKPISMMEAVRLGVDEEYKRVAEEQVGPYWISTVWLGLDHNYGGGPPLIFETMVFTSSEINDPEHKGLHDLDCWRWSTEAEARRGHEEIVVLAHATTVDADEFLADQDHDVNHGTDSEMGEQ